MKRNKKKGFTLVELIAVIAILAILAAVVVPKISSYSDSARLSAKKADASTLLSSIQIYNAQADSTHQIDLSSATAKIGDLSGFTYDTTNAQSAGNDVKDIATRIVNKNKGIDTNTLLKDLAGILNATS